MLFFFINPYHHHYKELIQGCISPTTSSKDEQAFDCTGPAEGETNTIPVGSCFIALTLLDEKKVLKLLTS